MRHFPAALCLSLLQIFPLFLSGQAPASVADTALYRQLEEECTSLYSKARYSEAASVALRTLALTEQWYGVDSPEYGSWLDNAGSTLHLAGQYEEALDYLQRGVEHARVHLGLNHEDYVTRLNNLGMLYLDIGEYSKALNILEEVVSRAPAVLDEKDVGYSIFVNNLALAYESIREWDQTLKYNLLALELTEKSIGKTHYRYGIRLNNLGVTYRNFGQWDRSISLFEEALRVYEQSIGKENDFYFVTLSQLARTYTGKKEYGRTLQLSRQVAELTERKHGRLYPEFLSILNDIGDAQFGLGDYAGARQTLLEAESLAGQIFGKVESWRWAWRLFKDLAHAHEVTGDYEAAAGYLIRMADLFLNETQTLFDQLNQFDQESYLKDWEKRLDILMSYSLRRPELTTLTEKAFEMDLVIKELALNYRRNLLRSLPYSADTATTRMFARWQTLEETIGKQSALPSAKRMAGIDDMKQEALTLERQLASASASFREARQPVRWQDVRQALGEGEAAVEFCHFQLVAPDGQPRKDSILYAAFVLRKHDEHPRLVYLFEAKKLGDLGAIRRVYALAGTAETPTLHEILWLPLSSTLSGISTLNYSPSGLLHRINLGAVPVDARETMSQRFQLHRMGSTRHLALNRGAQPAVQPANAVVFGGINYDDEVAGNPGVARTSQAPNSAGPAGFRNLFSGGSAWEYLEWTKREADTVRSVLAGAGVQVWLGEGKAASEAALKQLFSQNTSPSVLHLATHGFFFPDRDENAKTGFIASDDPMVRCGLALAGANSVWQGKHPDPDSEDGILTAAEISLLNFRNTELVVLSACDTGLGELRGNEGVYGLQRAFKMAGAHYLLMSLWPASDRLTHEFMSVFYREWLQNKQNIPHAFQSAQNQLKAQYALPFNPSAWAGFILVE